MGSLHLRLRGIIGRLTLVELHRTLKSFLPRRCFHLVINTEGLHFASEQAAANFSLYLEKIAERVWRLQVITAGDATPEPYSRAADQGSRALSSSSADL